MLVLLRTLCCACFLCLCSAFICMPIATAVFGVTSVLQEYASEGGFISLDLSTDAILYYISIIYAFFLSLFFLSWLIAYLTPLSIQHKSAFNGAKLYTPKLNKSQQAIWNSCLKRFGIKRCKLLLANTPMVNAYALSNLYQKEVVITKRLFNSISEDELCFLLSHELAHIKCRDALVSASWLGAMNTLSLIGSTLIRIETAFLNSILAMFRARNLLEMIIALPISMLAFLIHYLNLVTRRIGLWSFFKFYTLLDRWCSRRVEIRCDLLAVKSSKQALRGSTLLLERLPNGGEFSFSWLMRSHPSNKKRLKRIQCAI